jgi:hypothetical protein
MNVETEEIWKKAVVAYFKALSAYLVGMKEDPHADPQ